MIQFAHPGLLWLLTILIPLIVWYIVKRRNAYPSISVSSTLPFKGKRTPLRAMMLHGLFLLRLLAIACVIVMLARPQTRDSWRTSQTEGTDIILALDISSSMLARDFKPDRLEAAKDVANKFVSGREADNMGLVIFAAESFTGMPMTTDRSEERV